MKVFGAGYNLALFEKHVLVILEEARLDYEKALPNLEVYLGEVFRKDACQAKSGELFLPDADVYRQEHGAKAGAMLAQTFLDLFGKMVREIYLPETSLQWGELEKLAGITLDFNRYHLPDMDSPYCPAAEVAEGFFTAALRGQTQLELSRLVGVRKISTRLNYHSLRHWFYSLWGQNYEWGNFTINERTAQANGNLYQFALPPSWEGENVVIEPRQLLEAHGFKVVVEPGRAMEYWR